MDLNNLNIEKIIDKINKVKPFSGVVLVQQNDKIIFQRAYGFARK
ncbi:hypothetical protein [Clostridium estertheticum]|nr:hypothetical protein [Clostridium estertheticum]